MTATSRDGTTRSKTFLREMYKNSPLTKPLDTTPSLLGGQPRKLAVVLLLLALEMETCHISSI